MAMASSPFSPKSLLDRFRSPVFIASALSLGAHGVFFAAMPMLSASEDLQDKEESVPVVALSAEESQRLPDAVRSNRSRAFFGNDAVVPQDNGSLLPVPGIPPYGDLSGLDSGFNDPLQTTPPLWGNPVDIFQDSLPAIPKQTSIIFPETNALVGEPFSLPLDSSSIVSNDQAPVLPEESKPLIPDNNDKPVAAQDEPLINGSDEVPGSGLEAPIVASAEGTTVDNAFGPGETTPTEPVDPNQLASADPSANEGPSNPQPQLSPEQAQPIANNDPALLALRAEQQRLRDGYSNNGRGGADMGAVAAAVGQLSSDQSLALKRGQALVVQYPDPNFKCPADSLPALFTLVTQTDGSILTPELVQSTQYPALDAAAQDAAATFAADLAEPGIYQLRVKFEDEAGRCATQDDATA